uniref:NDUFA4 family protein n=2 Tax=unclassified Salmonella TaxID=2614656 RepID=UPI00397E97B2
FAHIISAKMQGLTIKSLRSHYALLPLFVCVGGGAVFATFYLFRLTQNADASWNRAKNPHPWQMIKDDQQTKFLSMKTDYKDLKHPRPVDY